VGLRGADREHRDDWLTTLAFGNIDFLPRKLRGRRRTFELSIHNELAASELGTFQARVGLSICTAVYIVERIAHDPRGESTYRKQTGGSTTGNRGTFSPLIYQPDLLPESRECAVLIAETGEDHRGSGETGGPPGHTKKFVAPGTRVGVTESVGSLPSIGGRTSGIFEEPDRFVRPRRTFPTG
jgi:hypothetical protein